MNIPLPAFTSSSCQFYNNQIDSSTEPRTSNDQLCENYMEVLSPFYNAFESVYKFNTDLLKLA